MVGAWLVVVFRVPAVPPMQLHGWRRLVRGSAKHRLHIPRIKRGPPIVNSSSGNGVHTLHGLRGAAFCDTIFLGLKKLRIFKGRCMQCYSMSLDTALFRSNYSSRHVSCKSCRGWIRLTACSLISSSLCASATSATALAWCSTAEPCSNGDGSDCDCWVGRDQPGCPFCLLLLLRTHLLCTYRDEGYMPKQFHTLSLRYS